VRVVAVRAGHEAFVDAMLGGHGELGADVGVAAVAEVGLLFGQQVLGSLRFVDGVATIAGDVGLCVNGAADFGARPILGVASKAGVKRLACAHEQERARNRAASALGLDVTLAGTVTAFAASAFWNFRAAGDALVVSIAEEGLPKIGVTRLAGIAANVAILRP